MSASTFNGTHQPQTTTNNANTPQPMDLDEPAVQSKVKVPKMNGHDEEEPPPTQSSAPDRRAANLQQLFDGAVTATLGKVSYANFSTCFPTPAEYRPEVLKRFWGDFVGRLGSKWKEQFQHILQKRNVVPSLNALDHLIADAVSRKRTAEATAASSNKGVVVPVPPHTLNPEALLVAKLGPWLGEQRSTLEGTLKDIEGENEKLGEKIRDQREEIDVLVKGLEALVRDLEKSAEMVGGVEGIRGVAVDDEMED